jgi:hypothetical protein
MPSLMERGVRAHAKRLMASSGVAVRAFRGTAELGLRRAVPGRRGSAETGSAPAPVSPRSKEIDWLIEAGDYLLDGQPTTPRRDDRIEWTDLSGTVHEFAVLPWRGELCSEPADQLGALVRVHSKRKRERK